MDDFKGVGASSADADVTQDKSGDQKISSSPTDGPKDPSIKDNMVPVAGGTSDIDETSSNLTDRPLDPTSTEDDLAPVAGTSNIDKTNSRVQEDNHDLDSDNNSEPLLDKNANSKPKRCNPFNKKISEDASNFREKMEPNASSSQMEVSDANDGQQSELSTGADKMLKKPLNEILNDAGQFSFVALCSVKLTLLFEDEWNKDWKTKTVKSLVKHMKLPKKTEETMLMFMTTHQDEQSATIFADSLVSGPCLVKPQYIPQDLIGYALSGGQYDARTRVLALTVARSVGVQEDEVQDFEATIVSSFIQEEVLLSEEEQKENHKRAKMKKMKRFAMIGAAAVGGGALIGLTGGLAAPLIASAGVALVGGSVGFIGTAAGVAVLASVFGAAGAGLTGYKMRKRVGEIQEFEFDSLSDEKDLHVTIAISGWLTKDTLNNFSLPWMTLATSKEVYCLRWESKFLLELGEALSMIINKMMTMAAKEALKMTVLAGLVVAFALPATAYSSLVAIDNPWSVVTNRAAQAGKQLAEVLLSRHQGKRPVTLVGFSMGARVIFFCLKELANRKGCEGIVQDAVLLGAPVPSTLKYWKPFARVVAGRIINGYCRGDWLLQFVYRAASVQMIDIAGLEPVQWKDRRMVNVDLTEIVNGHFDYAEKMDDILKIIGLRTRTSRVSSKLAKLTRGAKGQLESDLSSDDSEDDDDIPIIDAADLILPASSNPSTTKESISQSASEPDCTGRNQSELDQASSCLDDMSLNDSPVSVHQVKSPSIDQSGADIKLPDVAIGQEDSAGKGYSITSEGMSSNVEVGEELVG
ncbi:transmembrane and coiled-coil domain-containing protein 4-like isoform X2 [Asterias amurensis]|uniref:transmembrane and coiled-coil domain-containing protein 4-like isoform X2 n=1 Tax=Asterias amurensis TaxID=7602 RepID=UPI003AB7A7CC